MVSSCPWPRLDPSLHFMLSCMRVVTRWLPPPPRRFVSSSPGVKPPNSYRALEEAITPLLVCSPRPKYLYLAARTPFTRGQVPVPGLPRSGVLPARHLAGLFPMYPGRSSTLTALHPSHSLAPREPDLFVYSMYLISVRTRARRSAYLNIIMIYRLYAGCPSQSVRS